ncbi:MAG: hypothetical protein CMB99_04625 [Flavobacteriaceae bacterium]|nr:hypothetical protein [Flavobacteriaceae bacterium]|tara:strand:- start:8436 stop:9806 length:1371 start_codon:yes stop_codon:yes gene_type:complete
MMRICTLLFIIWVFQSIAQSKQILYDFADLPQSSLLNPGLTNENKFHFGVPLLSGISTGFGSSGFTAYDLFANDGRTFNDKVNQVFNQLTNRDFATINTQIELINAGFRFNKDIYISFGFYHEIDAIAYYPKDIITLINEGNGAYVNRVFSISQVNVSFDAIGVAHVGATVQLDEKLSVGGRLKMYSSAANYQTRNNQGTFTTVEGANNIYTHYLNNIDFTMNSSGFYQNDTFINDASQYIKNTFFGPNSGLGIDLGMAYKISPQLQFSASILDLGYIKHKENTQNNVVQGSYTFEGVNFQYDPTNPTNYWEQISDEFKRQIPTTDNQDSYTTWRPMRFNAALKYSFGERRSKICYDNRYEEFYTDAVGAQLFTIFRPLFPQMALTGFYQKSLTDKIHAKATYTIDDFSASNLGFGLSVQLSKFNVYAAFDNILNYGNLAKANNVSLQLGMNLIFN